MRNIELDDLELYKTAEAVAAQQTQIFSDFCAKLRDEKGVAEGDQIDAHGHVLGKHLRLTVEETGSLNENNRNAEAARFHLRMVIDYLRKKYFMAEYDKLGPKGEIITLEMVRKRIDHIIDSLPTDMDPERQFRECPSAQMVRDLPRQAVQAMEEVA